MNRDERRELQKKGVSKDTINKIELLNKPCTIGEVVQLSRAAAEDVCGSALDNYRRDTSSLIMAMTLQLDILKDVLISKGLISEEEFLEMYKSSAKDFEDKQREFLESRKAKDSSVTTNLGDMKVSDIEVTEV